MIYLKGTEPNLDRFSVVLTPRARGVKIAKIAIAQDPSIQFFRPSGIYSSMYLCWDYTPPAPSRSHFLAKEMWTHFCASLTPLQGVFDFII